MNGVFLIVAGILIIICACITSIALEISPMDIGMGAMGGIIFALGICLCGEESHPTALDVYRGKTTLEITYKDSVAIDSVVVFK